MVATGFNHVTIHADDVDESVEFYTEVFGLEPLPTPTFDVPLVWLRCGDRQLHVAERDLDPPPYHHFALEVDDFERVFELARERGIFDHGGETSSEPRLFSLPDGAVQLYLRDPAGNLVEVDWPESETLPDSIREHAVSRAEEVDQDEVAREARLFLDR